MKVWILNHEAGNLVHVSKDEATKQDIQTLFPEYEEALIYELRPGTTENTWLFYVETQTEVSVYG